MEKHFFAGTNSAVGFYSYFDHIINPNDAYRIYILKGGPGVGKSSFMKKVASHFNKKGLFVEYIHCSTDYNSLDGVHIPDYRFMIVDGTAPHVIEPKLPCLVEEILDFGKYLNRDYLMDYRNRIIEVSQEKSMLYQSGYRYLNMAGKLLEEEVKTYSLLTNTKKRCIIKRRLISDIDEVISNFKPNDKAGKLRKMFSDSYTPNGYYSYIDSLCKNKEVWELISPNCKDIGDLLETIVASLTIRGFDIEGYYHPLLPDILQHIYIKELNLMLISKNEESQTSNKSYLLYEETDIRDLEDKKLELNKNKELFDSLTSEGMSKFKEAKDKHEILEKIYIKAMDFKKVDQLYEKIIADYD